MAQSRAIARQVEVFFDGQSGVAEGPVWDEKHSRLVWTDIPAEVVHFTDFATGSDSQISTGGRVGAVVLRAGGGFVLAMENEFVVTGEDVASPVSRTPVTHDPRFRFNDGKCDPGGRFFAGLAGTDGRWGTAELYRFDSLGVATEVESGISCSNGIGWSPDGSIMYYVDTPTYRVDCFDFDIETGTPSHRRPFAAITDGYGRPDGLCVDAEGCVWVAIWGGYEVRRYSPNGTLLSSIQLPVSLVSSVAFGGPDLTTMFITSARDIPKHQIASEPLAGAIFMVQPGVAGLPVSAFAG
jgi:sugar lactone lactonase YvrE